MNLYPKPVLPTSPKQIGQSFHGALPAKPLPIVSKGPIAQPILQSSTPQPIVTGSRISPVNTGGPPVGITHLAQGLFA